MVDQNIGSLREIVLEHVNESKRAIFFSYTCSQIISLKRNKLVLWLAPAWVIITTILLCLPGSVIPKETWFDKIWLDKWIHIALFAPMVFLWCWFVGGARENRTSAFVQVFLYSVLYGIAMEFVQKYFIPNRSFDIGDMVADGIGSAAGLLISLRLLEKNRPL